MRVDLLKACEQRFLETYPGGFTHPEMDAIKKKHKPEKMQSMVQDMFAPDQFGFPNMIVENMAKLISRSSLISVFEKPKFKDFAASLSDDEKAALSEGLYQRLHGNKELGFQMMLDILVKGKMAKWSIMSVIPYYYYPKKEAFMKPTTVKNIIKTFELEGLVYKPKPSYEFYVEFRKQLFEMKELVDPALHPDNAAFTGFLMMMMM